MDYTDLGGTGHMNLALWDCTTHLCKVVVQSYFAHFSVGLIANRVRIKWSHNRFTTCWSLTKCMQPTSSRCCSHHWKWFPQSMGPYQNCSVIYLSTASFHQLFLEAQLHMEVILSFTKHEAARRVTIWGQNKRNRLILMLGGNWSNILVLPLVSASWILKTLQTHSAVNCWSHTLGIVHAVNVKPFAAGAAWEETMPLQLYIIVHPSGMVCMPHHHSCCCHCHHHSLYHFVI